MKKYHTVIVGAGPAGLACATLLARAGREVLVLERRQRIGPKICAGGITWSGAKQRVPEYLLQKVFPSQHIRTTWQQAIISADHPLVSTVNREDLGQWQIQQARAAGAKILNPTPVTRVAADHLEAGGETFGFHNLVGADGSGSKVRQYLGLPTLEVGAGLNCFIPGNFDHMEWHLDPRLFNNGYAWIFPHRDSASIGAYASRLTTRPWILQKNFRHWAAKRGINLGAVKLTAALINYDFRGWRFGNFFLVGDAAGLASPLTGEGIYPAIVSGEEVARAIIDPDYRTPQLAELLIRHRRHRRLVMLTGVNRVASQLILEIMVLALRAGLVPFTALEMAGHMDN